MWVETVKGKMGTVRRLGKWKRSSWEHLGAEVEQWREEAQGETRLSLN